jgi:hypothetical protein
MATAKRPLTSVEGLAIRGKLAVSAGGAFVGQAVLGLLLGADQLAERRGRQRLAEMIALVLIAAQGFEELELFGRFDAFGDYFELKSVRE